MASRSALLGVLCAAALLAAPARAADEPPSKEPGPKAKDAMESVLKEEAGALKSIAEARIRGDIDDDELESQLEDEKATLEAGLAMVAVVAKVSLQNAVNAAINVFWKAVKGAIDTAI